MVDEALTTGPPGPYQVQAAIAALHAQAKTSGDTDWPQIAALYEKLLEFNGSAVIALNHAVAVTKSAGLAEGLSRIEALGASGELDRYYLFHAARADILLRMGRREESAKAYREVLALATNRVEKGFLKRRLVELTEAT
jgi:RNA polymerase sigma-70 factor (ECF subfamily)